MTVQAFSAEDAQQAHRILSELCYNHNPQESLTDLALRVQNVLNAAVESETAEPEAQG